MNLFTRLYNFIKEAFDQVFGKKLEDGVVASDMRTALTEWQNAYRNEPSWAQGYVKTLGLAKFIAEELARQTCIELDAKVEDEWVNTEFQRCINELMLNAERFIASGGGVIKPYVVDDHIRFDWCPEWAFIPIAFNDGKITDAVFVDHYTDNGDHYTRLERHTYADGIVTITNTAFWSRDENKLGAQIGLDAVDIWADLEDEVKIASTGGMLFAYYKNPITNNIDEDSALGISIYGNAMGLMEQADKQYSRLLWEYEGSELAIDIDPTAMRKRKDQKGYEMAQLNERLFRKVDNGKEGLYEVFAPSIRDGSIINGLNALLMRIEDSCGLAHGTISSPDTVARTATELKIAKQRTYATITGIQASLEVALREVVRIISVYGKLYGLHNSTDPEVAFTWDDSVVTDSAQQIAERQALVNMGAMSKVEYRMWYFGEDEETAKKAVASALAEKTAEYNGLVMR